MAIVRRARSMPLSIGAERSRLDDAALVAGARPLDRVPSGPGARRLGAPLGRGVKLVVLQHVPFEGPAAIANWARARGYGLEVRRVFEGAPLPAPGEADGLVVMGGPMSVNDEGLLPWLAAERRCLAEFLEADRRVLGVCLGAQLLARTAGARVYPAAEKEIGWLAVERLPAAAGSPLASLPERFVPLHWHGET